MLCLQDTFTTKWHDAPAQKTPCNACWKKTLKYIHISSSDTVQFLGVSGYQVPSGTAKILPLHNSMARKVLGDIGSSHQTRQSLQSQCHKMFLQKIATIATFIFLQNRHRHTRLKRLEKSKDIRMIQFWHQGDLKSSTATALTASKL